MGRTAEQHTAESWQNGGYALEEASLDALIRKLNSLSTAKQDLEGMLRRAEKKVCFYEGFDDIVQDAMAYSLRAAFQIREKAEREASEIIDQARSEQGHLKQEIAHLWREREALTTERNALRMEIEAARNGRCEAPSYGSSAYSVPAYAAPSRDRQLLAEVETLESKLRSLRGNLESLPATANGGDRVMPRGEDVSPRQVHRAAPPPNGVNGCGHDEGSYERVPMAEPIDVFGEYAPPLNDRASVAITEPPMAPATETRSLPAAGERTHRVVPALRDVDAVRDGRNGVADRAENIPPATRENGFAGYNGGGRRADVGARNGAAAKPGTEIDLVASPVHAFPKLVELERAVLGLAEVKSCYIRSFQHGVATILVRLAGPEARNPFIDKLQALPAWNLTILACPNRRVEVKVGA